MSCDAQTIEAGSVAQGYQFISELDVWRAIAAALSLAQGNITAEQAMAGAVSSGYLSLGDRDLDWAILAALTATPGNALLTQLAYYWKMDEVSGNRVDTQGGINLVSSGGIGNVPGVIGLAAGPFGQSVNDCLQASSSSVGRILAGQSFTVSIWVKLASSSSYNGKPILAKWGAVAGEYQLIPNSPSGNNTVLWQVRNAANGATVTIDTLLDLTANGGQWAHFVAGYDAANSQIFCQVNGGTRLTASCVGVNSFTNQLTVGNKSNVGAGCTVDVDEFGFWYRALSAAEATQLYNGGAGFPVTEF